MLDISPTRGEESFFAEKFLVSRQQAHTQMGTEKSASATDEDQFPNIRIDFLGILLKSGMPGASLYEAIARKASSISLIIRLLGGI